MSLVRKKILTEELVVKNPLVELHNEAIAAGGADDTHDIGIFGQYWNGSNTIYTGLFRDASDSGRYILFDGLQDNPVVDTGLVNTSGTGYSLADLVVNSVDMSGTLIIDADNAEAFLVRKDGDAGDVFAIDTLNDQILFANGAEATPSITFISDPNTGIYNVGADQIGISTGGVKRLDITDTQLIVNQTTSSTDKDTGALVVEGGVGIEENLNVGESATFGSDTSTSSTSTTSGTVVVTGGVGISENINVGGTSTVVGISTLSDTIIDQDGTEVLLVRKDGDAGDILAVDTTNEQLLMIAVDDAVNPAYSFLGDTNTGMFNAGANEIGFTTDGTERMSISDALITMELPALIDNDNTEAFLVRKDGDSGDIFVVDTVNEQILVDAENDATNPTISFVGDTDTGIYNIGADNLGISTGGTLRMDVNGTRTVITQTTSSTDKDTGALIVEGGVGIEENLNVGESATFGSDTSTGSTSTTTGTVVITGGTGISENLYVGGLFDVAGNASIGGDLFVSGTTTTVNSETLTVDDNIIIANADVTKEDGGFVVQRSVANIIAADTAKETGTVSSGTSSTEFAIALGAAGVGTTDYYKGWVVQLTGGTESGSSYVLSSTSADPPVLTVETAMTGTPAGDETYNLYNRKFVGTIYDESTDKISFYGFPVEDTQSVLDPTAADGTAPEYLDMVANNGEFKNDVVIDNDLTVNGNLTIGGSSVMDPNPQPSLTISSTSTITETQLLEHRLIYVDTSGGNVTVTLPDLSGLSSIADYVYLVSFVKINGSNNMIIAADASDTIDGDASFTFTEQWDRFTLSGLAEHNIWLID